MPIAFDLGCKATKKKLSTWDVKQQKKKKYWQGITECRMYRVNQLDECACTTGHSLAEYWPILGNFSCFFVVCCFFFHIFRKILSVIPSECHTAWIKIGPGSILFAKIKEQAPLVGKEWNNLFVTCLLEESHLSWLCSSLICRRVWE